MKIQRNFRSYLRSLPVDPITQDTPELPLLIFQEDGTMFRFGAETMADYILTTGDTRNPLTRKELDREVILDLERITSRKILSKLAIAKQQQDREREIASIYEYFEGIIYDILTDILNECARVDTSVVQKVVTCKIKLRIGLFPAFNSFMQAIKNNNPDDWEVMCNQKLDNMLSHIESHLLSHLYYEEMAIEEIKFDINKVIPQKIISMRDDDGDDG